MPIIAASFLLFMLAATFVWQQSILLKYAHNIFAQQGQCATKIWRYKEDAQDSCIAPRTDHGYLDGKKFRAAGAICWYVLRSSLPHETIFRPNTEDQSKGYRCDFP